MSAAGEALARACNGLRIRIDFPELEAVGIEGPFYATALTLKARESYRDAMSRNDSRVWGQLLRDRLEDANGDPVFDKSDEMFFDHELWQAMVERVALQIWEASSASFEAALKNCKATPSYTGDSKSLVSAA